jgi:hypothetical protein
MAGDPKLSTRAIDVDSINDVGTLRSLMKAQLERASALERRLESKEGVSGGGMKDRYFVTFFLLSLSCIQMASLRHAAGMRGDSLGPWCKNRRRFHMFDTRQLPADS